jgi:hypothetical protein
MSMAKSTIKNEKKGIKKMINILETIRQGDIGGGETHVLDLANMDRSKFEPMCFLLRTVQCLKRQKLGLKLM